MDVSSARLALGDALNPILVKEVRQALRGRGFRILLSITLLIAAGISALVLVQADTTGNTAQAGIALLVVLISCLFLTLIGLVPLFAFQTFAQEWEESTLDLLLLSHLTAGRIAFGKWLTVMLLAVLVVVAFAPFLAMALLLEGTDPLATLVLIAGALFLSGVYSAVGMALAGTLRGRGARGAGQGMLALSGLGTAIGLISFATFAMGMPQVVRDAEFLREAWALALFLVFAALLFLMAARAHLAHPEEGPSVRARAALVLGAFFVPLLAALPAWIQGVRAEWTVMWIFYGLLLMGSLFVLMGERPALGRVVASRLGRRGALGVLAHPFLPGAGRTPALALLTFAAVAAALGVLKATGAYPNSLRVLFVVCLYAWIYLVPALLLGSFARDRHGRRWALRLVALGVGPLWFAGGALLGSAIDDQDLMFGKHLGNPVYAGGEILTKWDGSGTPLIGWLLLLAGLGVLAVLPSVLAALAEERRARLDGPVVRAPGARA